MPITEAQREARKKHIGSSDAPAILGVSPYSTAFDVWLEKTGQVDMASEEKDWLEEGNMLEPAILAYASKHLGTMTANQYRTRPDLHIGAHIDAILNGSGEPVEAKRVDYWNPDFGAWGEPGTDQVSNYAIIQSHVHMLCLDGKTYPRVCHVPALIGGRFGLYRVERNDDICEAIMTAVPAFWQNHVEPYLNDGTLIPPPQSVPSLDVIKRVSRIGDVKAQIDPQIVRQWEMVREARLGFERAEKACSAIILAALRTDAGFVEAADFGDDERIITYLEQNSPPSADLTALKTDGLYKKYVSQGKHRVLRISKKKD